MSLINKMLQDLDARGSQSGDFIDLDVKSVVQTEPRVSTPLLAAVLLGVIVLAVAGIYGWRYFTRPATPVATSPAPVVRPIATVSAPMARIGDPGTTPVAPVQAAPVIAPPEPAAAPAVRARTEARAAASKVEPQAEPEMVETVEPPKPARAPAPLRSTPAPRAAEVPVATPGRSAAGARNAQSVYAAALDDLQNGRVNDAMSGLEQALQLEPRHEAARQTLVGLLIEAGRPDQAMGLLEAGLLLDPRQPALAMLLARLQIERGASGTATLARSASAAGGNAAYLALYAGALQREQRHVEAAEQYMGALRLQPQNGIWLMGLGISLQAAGRNAEAIDAFQRAKASGTLSPQLLAFVERKLQAL